MPLAARAVMGQTQKCAALVDKDPPIGVNLQRARVRVAGVR